MRRLLTLSAVALFVSGCLSDVMPGINWQRMIHQTRAVLYGVAERFTDHRAMRTPVSGTIPWHAAVDDPALTTGMVGGAYVTTVPIPIDRAALEAGERHFETVCAACHGALGNGDSVVARKMELRKPPSLLGDEVRRLAPGRIFRVMSGGYGLMPSLREQLPVTARWQVVAFVRALELSQRVALDRLPAPLKAQAEAHLEGQGR